MKGRALQVEIAMLEAHAKYGGYVKAARRWFFAILVLLTPSATWSANSALIVPSMKMLQSYSAATMQQGGTFILSSYYDDCTAGGGIFTWLTAIQAGNLKPDNGVVIAPADHADTCAFGCLFRQITPGHLSAAMYGAYGDGKHPDTHAIQAALDGAAALFNGGIVIIPAGSYKTTAPLTIPSHVDLEGEGRLTTIIQPSGKFAEAILASGASFVNWGDSIQVGNLTIDGANLTGNGLVVKWCGLRCHFHDLYIINLKGTANNDTTGVGLRVISSFDHTYERIEVRNTASYPVEIYEQQIHPDGVYNELSYLRFYDVMAIGGNSGGVQWNQAGGDNCEFWIKPSEGRIGFQVSRNALSLKIHTLYYDALTANAGIAADVDAPFANNIYFENIYGYNNRYNVQVTQGINTYVGHSFINSRASGAANVHITKTATAPVYLTVPGISYVDDNANSIVVQPTMTKH